MDRQRDEFWLEVLLPSEGLKDTHWPGRGVWREGLKITFHQRQGRDWLGPQQRQGDGDLQGGEQRFP